ncbi:LacI family DNA-binding transcriptional regulator [Microlunatus parietis]|uniref:DNA-binding LacI/PurR family transcriptional regulator n=1 Tax=Microlunatus parietis TaxID=682979 RepID=A0A7Y9I291_9ACTN|nr:LacI family DNA-binding transcriptional regulator [Microlunatus parietis]NYE68904.1 DNA-binding LacI/PurR family transcriptional regulator [Microlunatus parietis]
MADKRPRITIATIADQAGVSIPTVSKVLNGRGDVAPATRELVEAQLRESGYQRRRTAAPSPVPMIDLVFHDLGNPWAVEVIRGVEEAAREENVEVVLSECGAARRPRQEWINSVLIRRPAGVIMVFSDLAPDQRAQLDARQIPYVVVDPIGEEDESVASIGSNNWSGGRAATRHLIELGHRRIAAISGPADTLCARARMDGYVDALRRAGLPDAPELVRVGDFSVEGGYRCARDLLALRDRPTAIFAGSDMQALGVLRAARELGWDVPQDLSVVGYDDLPLASWVWPRLTTVAQPLVEMAGQATRLVLALARGEQPAVRKMDLAVRLVERESTAAWPGGPAAGQGQDRS